jgi:GTP-binding protein
VGKSTFVNRVAQVHDAIVHEQSGVTRDRSYHEAEWNGVRFTLVDTGGIELDAMRIANGASDPFQTPIREQAIMATQESDAVIFLTDGTVGVTPDDIELARLLKRSRQPVLLAVNKLDDPSKEDGVWDFYSLGLGDPWPVSSIHGHGTGDILDKLVSLLPEPDNAEDDMIDAINVAIIGRPNAGKSSLINKLAGYERSIVSDVAGTTRDAVDALVEHDDVMYRFVDTAGLRKRSKVEESVEYYGLVRAMRAIDRADVALLVIDSTVGLTDQDQRVAAMSRDAGCALVVLLNKWDLLDTPEERDNVRDQIEDRLVFVSYAQSISISALTGRSVHRIWDAINIAYEHYASSISTARLNTLLTEIRDFGHTITKGKQRLRINYVTQTGTCPPHFTFFANHPALVDDNYERYLEGRLRSAFNLDGTPVMLHFKRKD